MIKVNVTQFSDGRTASSTGGIVVTPTGASVTKVDEVDVDDVVAKAYFKNPNEYVLDSKNKKIHKK